LHDLGTLGGASSCALAINDRGQVVGWAETASGERRAVLWHDGAILDLGTLPGSTRSEAWDLNDEGLIVGVCSDDGEGPDRACVWQAGTLADLGTLTGTTGAAWASAVNRVGQIVGGSVTGPNPYTSDYHAVLWDGGRIVDLGTLPRGRESQAWDLNDAGQVVGVAEAADGDDRAVLWECGRVTDLGTFGGPDGAARALNGAGHIAGAARTGGGAPHACLWRDGGMTDLGTLPGCHQSRACDLNDRGQVVGSARLRPAGAEIERAFFWQDGRMVGLDDLVDPAAGWQLTAARGLNHRGQIVGEGVIEGSRHAFLLTPGCPNLA
jgi:probable HAF family extracellular repeat protein